MKLCVPSRAVWGETVGDVHGRNDRLRCFAWGMEIEDDCCLDDARATYRRRGYDNNFSFVGSISGMIYQSGGGGTQLLETHLRGCWRH